MDNAPDACRDIGDERRGPMPYARLYRLMRAAAGVMLLCGVPAPAQDVKINIGLGALPLPPIVTTPPQLVVVPGTAVYYAPQAPTTLLFYQGRYYTLANNVWSTAP